MTTTQAHPFLRSPHRTLLTLAVPVMLSLIAEPLVGLVDTAFVQRLGAAPQAALGVGTAVLSGIFWVFNFLGIGTQTAIAHALGAGERSRASSLTALALTLSGLLGALLIGVGLAFLGPIAHLMGATGAVRDQAMVYLEIRCFGAPAVLAMSAGFGALRGLQDMRTPFRIAFFVNALNVVLDAVLIFGLGPVPALGIAGAAIASVISQCLGALLTITAVRARLGLRSGMRLRGAGQLLLVGRDLFLRTLLLSLFLLLTTRAANRIGTEAGAAHQVIRQVWLLSAFALDGFAAAAQSLVGTFLGARLIAQARRVAAFACAWALGTGALFSLLMWAMRPLAMGALVSSEARGAFLVPWLVAAWAQPLNALSFVTDGIHWGSGDYRFLRNGMLLATGLGALAVFALDLHAPGALTALWVITGGWIAVRAALGLLRIWPGLGSSPLALPRRAS